MTIFTTGKIILNIESSIWLEPIGKLTYFQMNELCLAISFLGKLECDKCFQCGVIH